MEQTANYFRIGILSDTHIRSGSASLPKALFDAFQGVDMILHAGDIQREEVLFELEAIAPVIAVAGNCDGWDLAHRLGRKRILKIGDYQIGLVHGTGRGPEAWRRAYLEFDEKLNVSNPVLDCLIFGHTHVPEMSFQGGMLVLNPGSAMEKRGQPYHTAAILEIGPDGLNPKIIKLDT